MKIVICTTPIRPMPTDYPPFGSLAIIRSLREAGYDPIFFDIDATRPTFAQVIDRFKKESPDLIGISAVVSTAYAYVKRLCRELKMVSPKSRIVLGGNLAASGELLHRLCGVDVCVIGEGERVMANLVRYYEGHREKEDFSQMEKIPGMTFLDGQGEMVFTGYEAALPADQLTDPDFSILEEHSRIENFIADPFSRWDFAQDPRSRQSHRVGKKMGTVTSTKGCVARCTFCHRWDKGFRAIPPQKVIGRIRYLMDRYNVGFIMFGDENFGSDLKSLDELITLLKPLDLLWQVGGVRARTIDVERLKRMRDAGCVALYYGFESGSPDILKVMEKNMDLADNLKAAQATWEAGLFTVYQLVLGMPGETHRTISETIEMVKSITEFLPEPAYPYLSINYIQALPGTPVYEYARARRLIGASLEDEDRYLLSISDIDAGDETKFLNFTSFPVLTVQSWRPRILYEATEHWYRRRRDWSKVLRVRASSQIGGGFKGYEKGGYFNIHTFSRNPFILRLFFPIRWLPIGLWTVGWALRRNPPRVFLRHLWEWLTWSFRKRVGAWRDYRSLRRILPGLAPVPTTRNEESMMPLRLGR